MNVLFCKPIIFSVKCVNKRAVAIWTLFMRLTVGRQVKGCKIMKYEHSILVYLEKIHQGSCNQSDH